MRRIKVWFSRFFAIILLFAIGGIITKFFGETSEVVKFYNEKILFTPYNITGIIMLILACCGVWCGKKGGHRILSVITKVMFVLTALSFISGVVSWIGLDIPKSIAHTAIVKIVHNLKVFGIVILSLFGASVLLFVVIKLVGTIKGKSNSSNMSNSSYRHNDINDLYQQSKMLKGILDREESQTSPDIKKQNALSSQVIVEKYEQNNTESSQEKIIDTFPESAYYIANKICPLCGGKLTGRQNHKTSKWFMGCENYFSSRRCEFTINYDKFKRLENCIKNHEGNIYVD